MTIADLEQLLREYIPDPCAGVNRRGRASVTKDVRYDKLESMSALRTAAPPAQAFWWNYEHKRLCLVCNKEFDRKGSRRKYCSDACQQKAYRERKKKQRS